MSRQEQEQITTLESAYGLPGPAVRRGRRVLCSRAVWAAAKSATLMSCSCLPGRHPNVEEAEDGIGHDPDSVYAEYRNPR